MNKRLREFLIFELVFGAIRHPINSCDRKYYLNGLRMKQVFRNISDFYVLFAVILYAMSLGTLLYRCNDFNRRNFRLYERLENKIIKNQHRRVFNRLSNCSEDDRINGCQSGIYGNVLFKIFRAARRSWMIIIIIIICCHGWEIFECQKN